MSARGLLSLVSPHADSSAQRKQWHPVHTAAKGIAEIRKVLNDRKASEERKQQALEQQAVDTAVSGAKTTVIKSAVLAAITGTAPEVSVPAAAASIAGHEVLNLVADFLPNQAPATRIGPAPLRGVARVKKPNGWSN
jgi:hypothetical protein